MVLWNHFTMALNDVSIFDARLGLEPSSTQEYASDLHTVETCEVSGGVPSQENGK